MKLLPWNSSLTQPTFRFERCSKRLPPAIAEADMLWGRERGEGGKRAFVVSIRFHVVPYVKLCNSCIVSEPLCGPYIGPLLR